MEYLDNFPHCNNVDLLGFCAISGWQYAVFMMWLHTYFVSNLGVIPYLISLPISVFDYSKIWDKWEISIWSAATRFEKSQQECKIVFFFHFILILLYHYHTLRLLWLCGFALNIQRDQKGKGKDWILISALTLQLVRFHMKLHSKENNWDIKRSPDKAAPIYSPQTAHIVVDDFT